jgi:hypothetical protein
MRAAQLRENPGPYKGLSGNLQSSVFGHGEKAKENRITQSSS